MNSSVVWIYDGDGAFGECSPAQIAGIKANVEERLDAQGITVVWSRDPTAGERIGNGQRKLVSRIVNEEVGAAWPSNRS